MRNSAAPFRNPCSQLVSILRSHRNRPQTLSGNLEEIGEWSALVLTESAIRPGTTVSISCETHKLTGFVESCTRDSSLGFFVEVQLDPASRWSQQWFTPQHLLALCQILQPQVFHPAMASGY